MNKQKGAYRRRAHQNAMAKRSKQLAIKKSSRKDIYQEDYEFIRILQEHDPTYEDMPPKDIAFIIQKYKEYILGTLEFFHGEEESKEDRTIRLNFNKQNPTIKIKPPEKLLKAYDAVGPHIDNPPVYPLGMKLEPGINIIYGKPDSLKTTIGIALTEWFIGHDLRAVYLDGENKVEQGELPQHKNVFYLKGINKSKDIVRKLVSMQAIDVLIVDTIVSVSNYSQMLTHLNKHLRRLGIYCVLLNQTRQYKYGDEMAGADIIQAFSRNTYRIVSCRKNEVQAQVKLENGHYIIFNIADDGFSHYHHGNTMLMNKRVSGEITKVKEAYNYEGDSFTRKEMIERLMEEESEWDITPPGSE